MVDRGEQGAIPPRSSSLLQREQSQDTVASLLQLDPSPIETPTPSVTDADKQLGASNSSSEPISNKSDKDDGHDGRGSREVAAANEGASSSTRVVRGSTTSAVGSGHGSLYYLTRIQRYASYATSVFLTLHISTVSIIPAITRSVPASETYLLQAREIYQTPLGEPLLIGLPVFLHVGSGVALRLLRRRQNIRRYGVISQDYDDNDVKGDRAPDHKAASQKPSSTTTTTTTTVRRPWSSSSWPPMSYISLSGYIFTVAYAGHVISNRGLPLAVEGDSSNVGLAFIAHGFARHPITANVAYVGLIAVAAGHITWGAARWLNLSPSTAGWWRGGIWRMRQPAGSLSSAGDEKSAKGGFVVDQKTRRSRRRKWLAVQGVAAAFAATWAVGGLGVVSRGGAADGWLGKLYDDLYAKVWLSSAP